MRRRLVAAFVGLAVAVILLFGIPRGIVVAQLVESERRAMLDKSADVAAYVVIDAAEDGEQVTPAVLEPLLDEGERLEYQLPGGSALVVPAGAGAPSDGDLTTERMLSGGGSLTVAYPADQLRGDVTRQLAPVAVLALLLIALAGAAGWLLARRLARPFTELAAVAEEFGRGRLDTEVPRYSIAEADAIARALDDASKSVQRMVRREREVSDHASHDLRTPITALRLTLEDLLLWPSTPPDVAQELRRILVEVDRFSSAVTTLVEAPTAARPAELVDVAAVLREAARNRPGPRSGGRIVVETPAAVLVRLPAGLVRRAVDLTLEHAAASSEGAVTAKVVAGSGYVVVELEGLLRGGDPTRAVVWDQAGGVAAELGGRLTTGRGDAGTTRWTLTLPREHAAGLVAGE